MIIPDIDILIGASRLDHPQHDLLRGWLEDVLRGPEPVGLTDAVLGGCLRIITNPRVYVYPTALDVALDLVDSLRRAPHTVQVTPGRRHWDIVATLCRQADARGSLVADAQHAAVAIEHGATWVSQDRDFARFEGLRWTIVR